VKDLGRHTSLNAAKGDVGDSVDNTDHHVVSIKVNTDVEAISCVFRKETSKIKNRNDAS
jgi:hypothetical protein